MSTRNQHSQSSNTNSSSSSSAVVDNNNLINNRKRLLSNSNKKDFDSNEDEINLGINKNNKNNFKFDLVPEQKLPNSSTIGANNYEREVEKFQRLSEDAKNQSIKAVARLFIMKGSHRESISRKMITDILDKIDTDFKKHFHAIMRKVQQELDEIFGYALLNAKDILGMQDHDKKEDYYYLTNKLLQPVLLNELAQNDNNAAYYGFMLIVLYTIFVSPGHKTIYKDLLAALRQYDSRFPDTLIPSEKTSLSIPELQDEFPGLISRMRKEQYVSTTKDDSDTKDIGKTIYTLGPRFYLDVGKKQLVKAYFALLDRPVDETILNDIAKEEAKLNAPPPEEEDVIAAQEGKR